MDSNEHTRTYWSSSAAFVIAAAGAVIGLGNVWRLPYLAGEYGGGAFLLVYSAALIAMVLPMLMAELVLGRGAPGHLVAMLRQWVLRAGLAGAWSWIGYLALAGAVAVLSYYSVIAGWSMAYVMRAAGGTLGTLDSEGLRDQFLQLVGDPEKGLGWHTIFIVSATICVAHGVRRGLEPVTRWLLAGAIVLLGVLLTAALSGAGAERAAVYLFRPDFAALGWRGVIEALHQAFFSLSLGVGVMLAFGAYLGSEVSLWRVGAAVVALDTAFAVIAGFAVTALLFNAGLSPAAGLQLIFEVMPAAAAQSGGWIAMLFFLMLVLVSLTSAVALMEPVVVWIRDRFGITRVFATTSAGLVIWFVGLGTLLSFNMLSEATVLDRTIFDWLSLLSSRLVLPVVGLLLCVFVGRFLPGPLVADHWAGPPGRSFGLWRWLLRYPSRVGLLLVVLYSVGVFTFVENLW